LKSKKCFLSRQIYVGKEEEKKDYKKRVHGEKQWKIAGKQKRRLKGREREKIEKVRREYRKGKVVLGK